MNKSKGWQGDGLIKFPDSGHRIPERVKLSWRELPKSGQKVYRGDLVGPFDLALRSRIPNDVLTQVRASRKYRLEMAFSVGVQPIQFRWRLVQADLDKSTPRVEVRRGGDW